MVAAKILVIDDEPAVRDAFELALMDEGYEIRTAENGLRGLALAEADKPDLIFLDLKMPGIDGVETMRRLHDLHGDLRIYIVTAFQREFMDPLRAARAEGCRFQVAAKPLSAEQIRSIVSAALGS